MERFMQFVNKHESGCWLWTGNTDNKGYGHFTMGPGRHKREQQSHRVSFILFKGEIPDGMLIRHMCNVRNCVNPEHLRPGTNGDNSSDKTRHKRPLSEECARFKHEAYILGWRYGASIQTRPDFVEDVGIFEEGYMAGAEALRQAQIASPYRATNDST